MDKLNLPGLSPYYGIGTGFTNVFQQLIRDLGDAKSKYEEDRIIKGEVRLLKETIGKPNITPKQMKEIMVRLIYCEMLGHEASFGYIHAIKFAEQSNLLQKRAGYLALCLLLHENHEMTLLLINTFQKDLCSSNVIHVCIALIAVCKLISKEMIPAVLPNVVNLLRHKREMVRKKAVMALLRFYHLYPSAVEDIKDRLQSALCDRDPSVMTAALTAYLTFVSESPASFRHLTSTFVNILKQVIEFKVHLDYTYYGVPAPWVQMKLYKILAELGADDQSESEKMYEILRQCLEVTIMDHNIGCAVVYECLRTIATIYPNKTLVEMAANRVGLFLVSKNNNLKYLGINVLAQLIRVDVSYAFRHQMTVIDCLSDPDETLKRKTLDLLYRITNASNVSMVCEKLISYLRSTVDVFLRADLVSRITTLAERYAPDNEWFIQTMNEVFELGGNLVRPEVAHNLMRLIGEGTDDDELDEELRLQAVHSYMDLIEKPTLPDILVQLICWVFGEYSYLVEQYEPEEVMEKLCSFLERKFEDETTKCWIITAVTKVAGQHCRIPQNIYTTLQQHLNLMDVDMRQRCCEVMSVMQDAEVLEDILPTDASCEDLELDSSLSFLDDYVSAALQNGATPYLPKHMRKEEPKKRVEECSGTTPQLKFTPYQRQLPPRRPLVEHQVTSQAVVQPPAEITSSLGQGNRSQSATEGLSLRNGAELGSNPNYRHGLTPSAKPKKQVWGPEGYSARRQTQAGPMSSGRSDSSDSTSGAGSLSGSSGKLVEKRSSIPEPQALPEFPKVPEDSERRKLADALFQGIGTTRDSRGTPNIEKAGVQPKRKHGKQRHTRTAGLGTRPKQDNVKPHPADKMLLDLDDSGVGETSGSELVDAIVEPKYQNDTSKVFTKDDNVQENDISSMFQGLKASSSEPNKAETTQPLLQYQIAKESPSLSDKNEEHDILDLQQLVSTEINEPHPILDSEAPPLTTPVVDNKSSAAEIVSVTNIMPKELEAYPRSEIKDVCADLNIRLCAHAIYTPTSLDLILTLRNQSSSKVTDVQLMVEPPSNLFASLDQESEMGTVDNLIEISQSVQHILSLTFKSPALNMCVGGHLNYKDATLTVKRLFINHRITTRDLLRPLMLTTGEFEMAWGSVAYDKKQDLGQSSFRSVKDAVSVLEKECRFSLVEIRGNDAILAGSILNKDKILVHAKVSPTDKKLTVKSGSKLLNDSIIKELVPLCCR